MADAAPTDKAALQRWCRFDSDGRWKTVAPARCRSGACCAGDGDGTAGSLSLPAEHRARVGSGGRPGKDHREICPAWC
jgi:hypothetical protein